MKSKRDVDVFLSKEIPSERMRKFLMTNLVEKDSKLKWRMNLDSISNNYATIMNFEETNSVFRNKTLFIRGDKSQICDEKYDPKIKMKFPNSEIVTIPNVGHWI